MVEIDSERLPPTRAGLSYAATALIAVLCLRVGLGPTPEHWLHIVTPMFLLACLTLSLAQDSTTGSVFKFETTALLSAVYILSTATLAQLSAWHWADKIGLAGFCLVTVLIGLEQSSWESQE